MRFQIVALVFLSLPPVAAPLIAAPQSGGDEGCPHCGSAPLPLSDMVEEAGHVLLASWQSGTQATDVSAGATKFKILKVVESEDDAFEVGQTIDFPEYFAGDNSTQFLLMGQGTRLSEWHDPQEISEEGWKYLSSLPLPVTSPEARVNRLRYFIKYLQHPEVTISNDAYGEFAASKYSTVKALKDDFPREQLQKWISDPDTPVTRMAFYGMLLGLCGNEESADVMEQIIFPPRTSFRMGIEGIMSGYLMIKGEKGLEVLEDRIIKTKTWIDQDGEEQDVPFSEVFAVMQTLRYLWTNEPDRINKDRLKQSMHLLLERPELADLIITDLSRWEDWSKMDRLMDMYDDPDFAIPSVKRAIVAYLFYAGQQTVEGSEEPTASAIQAKKYLNVLKLKDPATVKRKMRFLDE